MRTGSIVRNLKQPSMLICTECGDNRGYGFGGFSSAAATPLPIGWLKRGHKGWPGWLIAFAVIIFLLLLFIAIGHPPR